MTDSAPTHSTEDLFMVGDAGLPKILEGLRVRCDIALEYLPLRRVPLLGAGKVRGGEQAIGGITWLDWEAEFEDDPALPRLAPQSVVTDFSQPSHRPRFERASLRN